MLRNMMKLFQNDPSEATMTERNEYANSKAYITS